MEQNFDAALGQHVLQILTLMTALKASCTNRSPVLLLPRLGITGQEDAGGAVGLRRSLSPCRHASLSMTLGVYSHVQAAMKDEAAAAMDSTFS